MKSNHEAIASLLSKAINLCKDRSLADTKNYLVAAINSLEKSAKNITHKANQTKIYEEEAKKRREKWDQMLKDSYKFKLPGETDE